MENNIKRGTLKKINFDNFNNNVYIFNIFY